jgi:ElaB/YqjD/DUF883 family membrane-anchored ribosome-binding protein
MASDTKDMISDAGRGFAQTIRENPLPAAMVAAGIGWLLLSDRNRSRRDDSMVLYEAPLYDDGPSTAQRVIAGARSAADRVTSGVQNVAERVTSSVQDVAADVSEKAKSTTHVVAERAKATTHRVAESAKTATDTVAEKAKNATYRVSEKAKSAKRGVEDQFGESPIAVGAIAAAIGLAVGFALPASEKEKQIMGPARDDLLDKARDQIAETKEKVENVIDRAVPEVKSAIREAAREEGLSR